MMLPGTTTSPPYFLTPSRRPRLSRPLREEPPAFLCAIPHSFLGPPTAGRNRRAGAVERRTGPPVREPRTIGGRGRLSTTPKFPAGSGIFCITSRQVAKSTGFIADKALIIKYLTEPRRRCKCDASRG